MPFTLPPATQSPEGLDPSLLIGLPIIDNEHAALVAQLQGLLEASSDQATSAAFSESFSELGQMIGTHFDSEERKMASLGLPPADYASHVAAHDEILEQYASLNLDRMQGARLKPSEIIEVVKRWIVDHLLQHDIKIRAYWKRRGRTKLSAP